MRKNELNYPEASARSFKVKNHPGFDEKPPRLDPWATGMLKIIKELNLI